MSYFNDNQISAQCTLMLKNEPIIENNQQHVPDNSTDPQYIELDSIKNKLQEIYSRLGSQHEALVAKILEFTKKKNYQIGAQKEIEDLLAQKDETYQEYENVLQLYEEKLQCTANLSTIEAKNRIINENIKDLSRLAHHALSAYITFRGENQIYYWSETPTDPILRIKIHYLHSRLILPYNNKIRLLQLQKSSDISDNKMLDIDQKIYKQVLILLTQQSLILKQSQNIPDLLSANGQESINDSYKKLDAYFQQLNKLSKLFDRKSHLMYQNIQNKHTNKSKKHQKVLDTTLDHNRISDEINTKILKQKINIAHILSYNKMINQKPIIENYYKQHDEINPTEQITSFINNTLDVMPYHSQDKALWPIQHDYISWNSLMIYCCTIINYIKKIQEKLNLIK